MPPQHISYGVLITYTWTWIIHSIEHKQVPLKSNIYSDHEVLIFFILFLYILEEKPSKTKNKQK